MAPFVDVDDLRFRFDGTDGVYDGVRASINPELSYTFTTTKKVEWGSTLNSDIQSSPDNLHYKYANNSC